jgi:hypothetical protein
MYEPMHISQVHFSSKRVGEPATRYLRTYLHTYLDIVGYLGTLPCTLQFYQSSKGKQAMQLRAYGRPPEYTYYVVRRGRRGQDPTGRGGR